MKISNIEIKNFKSFHNVSVDLDNLNVLIGACSAGKTNFIEVFKFLKEISQDFNNAINIHAGSYLQNFTFENNENITLKISFNDDSYENPNFYLTNFKNSLNKEFDLQFRKITYEISFNFIEKKCRILNENVEFHFEIKNIEDEDISENILYLKNNNGKITSKLKYETVILKANDLIPDSLLYFAENSFKKSNIPIINSSLSTIPVPWKMLFDEIIFYDFDPKFCKNIHKQNGNINLTELGENLPFVLDKILTSDRRKFLNLVNLLFPHIKEIDVDKITDEAKIFTIIENYSNYIIPAPLVSDGTSNIIALLIALFFEKGTNALIEEPERNIHPSLLNKFVYLLKDASKQKQIITTTHSPELLKNTDLNSVLSIYRDVNGFSNITKPNDNEFLKEFIDEFKIDEVFVDNYMELGNKIS